MFLFRQRLKVKVAGSGRGHLKEGGVCRDICHQPSRRRGHGPVLVGEEGARGRSFCSNPDGQKGPELSSTTRYDKNGECSTGLLCPRVDHSWSNGGEFCFKRPQLFGDGAWRAAGAAPAPTARPGRGPPRGSGQPWCHPPAAQGHCGVTAGPMNSV